MAVFWWWWSTSTGGKVFGGCSSWLGRPCVLVVVTGILSGLGRVVQYQLHYAVAGTGLTDLDQRLLNIRIHCRLGTERAEAQAGDSQ